MANRNRLPSPIQMKKKNRSFRRFMVAPVVTITFFTTLGIIIWLKEGNILTAINYLYIGIFATLGMILYAILPQRKKLLGRRISFIMIGLMLFLGMGVMGRINGQIEGFFFYLLAGMSAGTVSHYLMAKIIGPILLQRGWCGWGCWTLTVLDLLPYRKSSGRIPGKWSWLRYTHFALALGLVFLLWFGFGYTIYRHNWDILGMYWFLAGNLFYYATGISLAIMLKDNRAFCKYICPITVFLKTSSIFSILRIKGDSQVCNECGVCSKTCPMDINIMKYVQAGERVLSTECILCLSCVSSCSTGTLEASLGFDLGGKELLNEGEIQKEMEL